MTDKPEKSIGGERIATMVKWKNRLSEKLGFQANGPLRATLFQALRDENFSGNGFSPQEREMLLRLLHFSASRVEDIMVPRADVIAADEDELVGDLVKTFREGGISRVPLYRDTLDDPDGMVHIKDLFVWLLDQGGQRQEENPPKTKKTNGKSEPDEILTRLDLSKVDLTRTIASIKIRRPVLYVPLSMPAMNLLIRMQSTRIHMALVVDEYGGTDGLVTIEDLVEQVVGDIEDEHDEAEEVYISLDKANDLLASARTPVEDLENHLKAKFLTDDEDEEIDTLGGLVFTLVGRVPARGEIVKHSSGLEFEVLDADPRRVKKLKVHKTNFKAGQRVADKVPSRAHAAREE